MIYFIQSNSVQRMIVMYENPGFQSENYGTDTNTLKYSNVGDLGYPLKDEKKKLTYNNVNRRKGSGPVVVMLILLLITAGAAGYLMFTDGLWPLVPFVFLTICMLTAYFSTIDRYSINTMVGFGIFEILFCGGIAALRFYFPWVFKNMSEDILFIGLCALETLLGAGMIIYTLVISHDLKKICTEPVIGRVVDLKREKRMIKGGTYYVYCPVYEYSYGGDVFQSCDHRFNKYVNPTVGSVRTLYIDPNYPMTYREPKRNAALSRRRMFDGIAFTLIGLILIFLITQ